MKWIIADDQGDRVRVLSEHDDLAEAKIYFRSLAGSVLGYVDEETGEFEIIAGTQSAGCYSHHVPRNYSRYGTRKNDNAAQVSDQEPRWYDFSPFNPSQDRKRRA